MATDVICSTKAFGNNVIHNQDCTGSNSGLPGSSASQHHFSDRLQPSHNLLDRLILLGEESQPPPCGRAPLASPAHPIAF